IKAIEAVRGREEYRRFKINFGKDRCGNPPRQLANQQQQSSSQNQEGVASPPPVSGGLQPSLSQAGSANSPALSPAPVSQHGSSSQGQQLSAPTASVILNAGTNNPLTMYLNQLSAQ